jgi:hypothetical protein
MMFRNQLKPHAVRMTLPISAQAPGRRASYRRGCQQHARCGEVHPAEAANRRRILERFQPDPKRSSSSFASNFIGLESLRVSSQADIALEQIPFAPEHANG